MTLVLTRIYVLYIFDRMQCLLTTMTLLQLLQGSQHIFISPLIEDF